MSTAEVSFMGFYLGAGLDSDSVEAAVERGMDFVGADAGTVDGGPFQLAGLGSMFPRPNCYGDLKKAIGAAKRLGVPLIVGSCGGAGSDDGVDWTYELVQQVLSEDGHTANVGRIYTELDKATVKQELRAGRVAPLWPEIPYDEDVVDASLRIVGVAGVEPIRECLARGCDIVLAGRTTDPAVFAAPLLDRGVDAGVAWHAGRIAECGAAVAEPAVIDLVYLTVRDDGFEVRGMMDPERARCTPRSVAEHQLYENPDPARCEQPGGTLDLSTATYDQLSDGVVWVSGGARFEPADSYSIKLEGVGFVGYEALAMASLRDPIVLDEFDEWYVSMQEEADVRIDRLVQAKAVAPDFELHWRAYGRDGTLGDRERETGVGHEVMIAVKTMAPTQSDANGIASLAWHTLIHHPSPGTKGFPTLAFPFSPNVIERGPAYRFNVNHIIAPVDDPLELVRIEIG